MLPLRWKLVALYALILTLVIGGFSAALALGQRRILVQALDRELEARARAVGALAETDRGTWILEGKTGIAEEYSLDRGLYYRVLDPKGAVLLDSPLSRTLGIGAPGTGAPREVRIGSRRFREAAVRVPKPPDPDEEMGPVVLSVVCGKDMAPLDLAMEGLIRQLLLIGPCVVLASLAGGFFLVGRALAPMDLRNTGRRSARIAPLHYR